VLSAEVDTGSAVRKRDISIPWSNPLDSDRTEFALEDSHPVCRDVSRLKERKSTVKANSVAR